MPDWSSTPISPSEAPPGPINPPAPDQIQPTDNGWNSWVRKETDKTGLKWTPDCAVSLEVSATGRTENRPLDGDNPDDYAAPDWGWKEDRTYETTPPEPYQDFTRWVRHFPKMRRQRCAQYKAQVFVRCGAHFVSSIPSYFWVADGKPTEGPCDEYDWTKTSGMANDSFGAPYKWTTTGKKKPPWWQKPQPASYDLSRPPEAPPPLLVHPPDYHFGPEDLWKPHLGGGWKDWLKPGYGYEFEPGDKPFKWFKFKDF